jgi:ribonuclease D
VPDAAIIEAAQAAPRSRNALGRLPGFATRSGQRYAKEFSAAINEAFELADTELPTLGQQHDGPPPPRAWADKNPPAAERLGRCREVIASLAGEHELPQENLISPDFVRRLAWEPPEPATIDNVRQTLTANGARPWQVELTAAALTEALAEPIDEER